MYENELSKLLQTLKAYGNNRKKQDEKYIIEHKKTFEEGYTPEKRNELLGAIESRYNEQKTQYESDFISVWNYRINAMKKQILSTYNGAITPDQKALLDVLGNIKGLSLEDIVNSEDTVKGSTIAEKALEQIANREGIHEYIRPLQRLNIALDELKKMGADYVPVYKHGALRGFEHARMFYDGRNRLMQELPYQEVPSDVNAMMDGIDYGSELYQFMSDMALDNYAKADKAL